MKNFNKPNKKSGDIFFREKSNMGYYRLKVNLFFGDGKRSDEGAFDSQKSKVKKIYKGE